MISRAKLGPAQHHYATVYKLALPWGYSLRVHHWYGHDDLEAYHDHPQWFWLLVLWGGYDDHCPRGDDPITATDLCSYKSYEPDGQRVDRLGWLSFRKRAAAYRHYVKPRTKHVWTLLLFGGEKRRWSFWETATGKRYKRDKWFAERGHHTQRGGQRLRMRPDGSVIGAEE